MTDFTSLAEKMYSGNATAAPATQAEPEQTAEQSIAQRLYPETRDPAPVADAPANIKALRAAEGPARTMYGQTAFVSQVPDGALGDGVDHGEARQVLQDLDLDDGEATALVRIAKDRPTSIEQVAAWQQDAKRAIAAEGITPGDLALAERLARRDPRVADWLRTSGAGNRIEVIRVLVNKAKSERSRGRL